MVEAGSPRRSAACGYAPTVRAMPDRLRVVHNLSLACGYLSVGVNQSQFACGLWRLMQDCSRRQSARRHAADAAALPAALAGAIRPSGSPAVHCRALASWAADPLWFIADFLDDVGVLAVALCPVSEERDRLTGEIAGTVVNVPIDEDRTAYETDQEAGQRNSSLRTPTKLRFGVLPPVELHLEKDVLVHAWGRLP